MLTLPVKFVGLDLECTGGDHRLHSVCQVGMCVRTAGGTPLMFRSDVGHAAGSYRWEEAALQVNKFTHERIQAGPRWPDVNALATTFLTTFAPQPKRLIPVGWAVGSFDLQFIDQESPELMSRLHKKHIDLTSVNYITSLLLHRDEGKLKKEAKAYAGEMASKEFAEFSKTEDAWHDAGFDAVASLYALQWYYDYLKSDKYIYSMLGQRLLSEIDPNGQAEETQTQEA